MILKNLHLYGIVPWPAEETTNHPFIPLGAVKK
jgi:hypothetical protein